MRTIAAADARRITKALHYSGKVVQSSAIHFGVFEGDRCGGVMSFGASMDKRRMAPLVQGTPMDGFVELNRMAFADWLPRNSESRCLAVALRFIRKNYPQIQWVVSFADGTQCGDGTIYRAAGFVLTQIKKNTSLLRMPNGEIVADKSLNEFVGVEALSRIAKGIVSRKSLDNVVVGGRRGSSIAKELGAVPLQGFQLRYVYFLDPTARDRLTCPILPFSAIDEAGAGMYRGKARGKRRSDAAGNQPDEGGANPTPALHHDEQRDG